MAAEDRVRVEVAFATAAEQALIRLEGEAGLTVRQAIERSGVLKRFPELDLAVNKVGIFGQLVRMDQVLESGDRVEIYRPLLADPKERRRKRAAGEKPVGQDRPSGFSGKSATSRRGKDLQP
jgi:putative ubiquitin-RnfH superfamily antitoxin RatB of RatAB toxin-antitoxin module